MNDLEFLQDKAKKPRQRKAYNLSLMLKRY